MSVTPRGQRRHFLPRSELMLYISPEDAATFNAIEDLRLRAGISRNAFICDLLKQAMQPKADA